MITLLVILAITFGAVLVKLAAVQISSSRRYTTVGHSQRVHTAVLPASRGSILDRNGSELTMSLTQTTIWANPRLVRDPRSVAHQLSGLLQTDEGTLRGRLTSDASFVYLARKVDDKVAADVKSLHLDGIASLPEPKRFQPAGPVAVPVLGSVGTDNRGLGGLESLYERELQGQAGELVVEKDPSGREIPEASRQLRPAVRGQDVVLTIDRSMQFETEQALAAEIVKSHARRGVAIVMDPRDGEILAMASLDAAGPGNSPVPSPSNTAVTNVYEPGSVNKVITIAGALEEGIIHPADRIVVPDHLTVADATIRDDEPHPTRPWTVTDIVANSSNVGTITIAKRLGKNRIDEYLRAFGLGTRTALRFPGESAGLLLPTRSWSGTSIATVPIGQGVAVTALQMLGVYNTVANGGIAAPPRLVKGLVDGDGRFHDARATAPHRVVSPTTAQQLGTMLGEVVRVGTGRLAAVDGYNVAGKTGTARKPLVGSRGYKEGAYVATFAGFAPAQSPRLSAIVVLDEPTPIYGGQVSAPVFSELAGFGLNLYRIPPVDPDTDAGTGGRKTPLVPTLSEDAARADRDAGPGGPGGLADSTRVPTTLVQSAPAKP